jgi:hypothetical protein
LLTSGKLCRHFYCANLLVDRLYDLVVEFLATDPEVRVPFPIF